MKKSYCHKFLLIITHASWGHFKYYIDLPYKFGILIVSTYFYFKWFFAKANKFYMKSTNAGELFSANNFYKNRIFTKTIFLLNHTSWRYFLDYMNLPYQFGILRMCTFCWFDWFLSEPSIILVIHTNTCALFFPQTLRHSLDLH